MLFHPAWPICLAWLAKSTRHASPVECWEGKQELWCAWLPRAEKRLPEMKNSTEPTQNAEVDSRALVPLSAALPASAAQTT